MYRKVSVTLCLLLSACAGPSIIQKPDGIPMCIESRRAPGYSGYAGDQTEIKNTVTGAISGVYADNIMYKMMGPMASAKMVIFGVNLKNISTESVTIDSNSLEIQGDAGMTISAIPPNKILEISRGANVNSSGFFEEMGEQTIKLKFSEPITIKPGKEDLLMVAFPLPLPYNPKIILSIGNKSDVIPICWNY